MINQKITKWTIASVIITLVAAASVVIPTGVVYGQGKGNMTAVIDVDTLSKNIKERHPLLGNMSADEDKDLVQTIKGLDPKEAAKTILAMNILRLLQQYKEVDIS